MHVCSFTCTTSHVHGRASKTVLHAWNIIYEGLLTRVSHVRCFWGFFVFRSEKPYLPNSYLLNKNCHFESKFSVSEKHAFCVENFSHIYSVQWGSTFIFTQRYKNDKGFANPFQANTFIPLKTRGFLTFSGCKELEHLLDHVFWNLKRTSALLGALIGC